MRKSSIRIALPWESYNVIKEYFELVCPAPNYNPFKSENMTFYMVNIKNNYVIIGWNDVFYFPTSDKEWAYYFAESLMNLDRLESLPYRFLKLDDNGDYEERDGLNKASKKLPSFSRCFVVEITENHNPAEYTYIVDNRPKQHKRGD